MKRRGFIAGPGHVGSALDALSDRGSASLLWVGAGNRVTDIKVTMCAASPHKTDEAAPDPDEENQVRPNVGMYLDSAAIKRPPRPDS